MGKFEVIVIVTLSTRTNGEHFPAINTFVLIILIIGCFLDGLRDSEPWWMFQIAIGKLTSDSEKLSRQTDGTVGDFECF